ncbi:MAG: CvpA family protein [Flavobacteriales bacterium]|nr:CvpA family protein [Flavobacteriales bacterium]
MNWLDWLLIALLAVAAVRGFFRGFVVELASLVALVLGIWAASHYNAAVAAWIGLDPRHEVISFLVTFIGVLVAIHLLAKLITKVMDLAQLGLPNKVAGLFFGALRAAFVLSVALNILMVRTEVSGLIPHRTLEQSMLFPSLRAFAPMIVPALGDTQWLKDGLQALKDEVGRS